MWKPIHDPMKKKKEPGKLIPGVFIRRSKGGRSTQIIVDDIDVFLIELRKRLTKKPEWKKDCGDKARVFYITDNGSIAEVWPEKEEKKERRPRTNPEIGNLF